jgi:protocadherin-16/23
MTNEFDPFPGGNLTYEIPKGIAGDRFTVDPTRGIVTTKGTFDRETQDSFTIPIYVMESNYRPALTSTTLPSTPFKSGGAFNTKKNNANIQNSQFDVATLVVRITDVNDHAPVLRAGSCYPLAIPENSDLAIVHTVVATDLDDGANGDITYSITGKLEPEL